MRWQASFGSSSTLELERRGARGDDDPLAITLNLESLSGVIFSPDRQLPLASFRPITVKPSPFHFHTLDQNVALFPALFGHLVCCFFHVLVSWSSGKDIARAFVMCVGAAGVCEVTQFITVRGRGLQFVVNFGLQHACHAH